jgi:hypothetical protein
MHLRSYLTRWLRMQGLTQSPLSLSSGIAMLEARRTQASTWGRGRSLTSWRRMLCSPYWWARARLR